MDNNDKTNENRIISLVKEIETYRQAIQDATDAMESAEYELREILNLEDDDPSDLNIE